MDCVTKASERIATVINEVPLWSLVSYLSFIRLCSLEFTLQVVKSPSLDYSHFVSLPLAIHPELVGKLFNFQNSILGNYGVSGDQQVDETTSVAVDLKANSETRQVNVDIRSIPLVSYPPKAIEARSSTLFGKNMN